MIVTRPEDFLAAYAAERFPMRGSPTARGAFLVSPVGFSLAEESAQDNRYMDLAHTPIAARALAQHGALAHALAGDVPTVTFAGDPSCPDGVFPNNVFATAPGKLVVGRMRHGVRRREAGREDIRAWFTDVLRYEVIDLSLASYVAELTGALVIDRARGVGFCGLSERCDMAGARAMHEAFDLKLTFCFELAPGEYHTNVVLAVLASRAAIIAPDGFRDAAAAAVIAQVYAAHVVTLDPAQRNAYAGNAIALSGERVWLSERGADSLNASQRGTLQSAGFALGTVDIAEIEKAGGSLRCCVAEIF